VARLTTHVLDTARGVPAEGIPIDLHQLRGGERTPVATATTNAAGRTDRPLHAPEHFEPGVYEITFHVEGYFRRVAAPVTDPPFLADITIRIGIAEPDGEYHVPLLLSPYGYSTYRGT
jgi:5-hydroxyisourate hydrolase